MRAAESLHLTAEDGPTDDARLLELARAMASLSEVDRERLAEMLRGE